MITLQDAKNLAWVNSDNTAFECLAKFNEFPDYIPTSANAIDPYQHIQELWANGLAGVYGPIAPYVPPPEPAPEPAPDQPQVSGAQTL